MTTTERSRVLRKASAERGLQVTGHEKSSRVDLGLALLSTLRRPGESFTRQDIAVWCGCTDAGIYMLEKRVLKKLANRLQFGRCRDAAHELEAV